MGRVRVTSRVNEWAATTERTVLDKALLDVATVIHRNAGILAPKDTRALVKSANIKRNGMADYSVRFGSDKVPYARIHELGGKTGRGYAVNIRAKKYLTRAGDAEAKRFLRGEYFRKF